MMRKTKQYDPGFRTQTAQYIIESGKPVAQVAREMEISADTLHTWVKKYKIAHTDWTNEQKFHSEAEKLRALEKQNRDLQEEVAILKKALHIFAKNPK